jgi:hypothetical protein
LTFQGGPDERLANIVNNRGGIAYSVDYDKLVVRVAGEIITLDKLTSELEIAGSILETMNGNGEVVPVKAKSTVGEEIPLLRPRPQLVSPGDCQSGYDNCAD